MKGQIVHETASQSLHKIEVTIIPLTKGGDKWT